MICPNCKTKINVGRMLARARAEKLTPARRSEICRAAAQARIKQTTAEQRSEAARKAWETRRGD